MKAPPTGKSSDKFKRCELNNGKVRALIAPGFGGSLQELSVEGVTVIEGSTLNAQGFKDYLSNCRSGVLIPFPNRVADGCYRFQGKKYQLEINEPENGHAIHGLVYDRSFSVVRQDKKQMVLQSNYPGSEGFPFPFECTLHYQLSESGFTMSVKLVNSGKMDIPFGMGWHPYFTVNDLDQCRIGLKTLSRYPCDDRMIPKEPKEFVQDGFALSGRVLDEAYFLGQPEVELLSTAYSMKMLLPKDSYLQLYTPPGRKRIAIEPMSCIANAYNNGIGLKVLQPDEEFKWEVKIEVRTN